MNENYSLEYTNCPLCKSDESSIWESFPPFKYVRCNKCNLVYASPRMSESTYQKNIESWGNNIVPVSEDILIRKEQIKLGYIKKWKKQGKILDVGCATGDFIKEAKKQGYEVIGIEAAKSYAEKARGYGLNVLCGDLLKIKIKDDSIDIMTMWDTIEHLYYPLEYLKKMLLILNKEGVLLIYTPNMEGASANLFGKKWWVFGPKDHIILFTPKTLKAMVEKTGYEICGLTTINVIGQTPSSVDDSLLNTRKYLRGDEKASVIGVFINICLRAINKYFPSLISRFNMGDHILLVARKTNLK